MFNTTKELLMHFFSKYSSLVLLFCGFFITGFLVLSSYESYSKVAEEFAMKIENKEISIEAARYFVDYKANSMFIEAAIAIMFSILMGALIVAKYIKFSTERIKNIDLRLWYIEKMMHTNYLEQQNSATRSRIDLLNEEISQIERDEEMNRKSGETD